MYFQLCKAVLVIQIGKVMGHLFTGGQRDYGIVNKAICGSKESAAPNDELEHMERNCPSPYTCKLHTTRYLQWWWNSFILQISPPQNLLLW